MIADPLPPAFYPVSLNLVGRRCVVIGDDREAIEKEAALREVGADVHWIRDPAAVRDDDIAAAFFVISTPQDAVLSARLRSLADAHRVLLCCIDQPAFGFVAMTAIVKAGPARIAISTGGVAPRVGKMLKEALERAMDGKFERFIDCLATQRRRNRARLPGSAERRAAMMRSAAGFTADVRFTYPAWYEDECRALGPTIDETSVETTGRS